jgi:hypothetical protein
MAKRNRFDENAWYVDFAVGVIGLLLSLHLFCNYESYLTRIVGYIPSGKGAKFFLVIIKIFDRIGGKPVAVGAILFFSILFFWWAYRKYEKMK